MRIEVGNLVLMGIVEFYVVRYVCMLEDLNDSSC